MLLDVYDVLLVYYCGLVAVYYLHCKNTTTKFCADGILENN